MNQQVRRRGPAASIPDTPPARERTPLPKPAVTVEKANRGQVYDTYAQDGDPTVSPSNLKGRVRVGGGVTRNMGDYESVRVHVEIELACENDLEAATTLYEELSGWVDETLLKEIKLATGEE